MSFRDAHGPAVIVDPYSSGAMLAPAFREYHVPVIAVTSAPEPPDVYAYAYRPDDFDEIITFAGNLETVLRRLRELRPRCVLAGCESGVELAEVLAPVVVPEVANVAELAAARRHKGAMAAAVAQAGLPTIPQISSADADEVGAWLSRYGLDGADLVIKPPKSASTDGVTRVAGGRGWREAFAAQIGQLNRLGIINDAVVVQRYMEGTEYVVDTVSVEGVHTVTDVCRYIKIENGQFMAVYDAMAWVSPDDRTIGPLVEYARAVLDAVGMRFGPAHVELMNTDSGPLLIEVAARAHGGGQPRFCQVATGDSQVARTVRYFALGEEPAPGYQLRCHMLVVFHIARQSGVVRGTSALDAIRQLPSHHFSVRQFEDGDKIEITKDLFGSLDLGFVVLAHPDKGQVMADYAAVRDLEARLTFESDNAIDP